MPNYTEYMEASLKLANNILGKDLVDEINRCEIIPFNWDGLDITTSSILAPSPSIRERFTEQGVDRYNEGGLTPLEALLGAMFHYGFESGEASVSNNEVLNRLNRVLEEHGR